MRVIIESPYAGNIELNLAYARACMRDSLKRGEYPFASHLLYTQPGILDDNIPQGRQWGINAGLEWGEAAQEMVVYADLGVTEGMKQGINKAEEGDMKIVYRTIGWTEKDMLQATHWV